MIFYEIAGRKRRGAGSLRKGLTQEALSAMVGVSAAAVSKWETNASYPDITLLPPLVRASEKDEAFAAIRNEPRFQAALDRLRASLPDSKT